ncbi:MAG TPA: nuclear transport factor 2 family protein [Acidobacteriaceae bacterium]|nr:nuclear transport factor 2 family protein [Acidobacteriaceae bacterium]
MRSLFIALFLLLAGVISPAQQTTKTSAESPEFREMQQVEDRWAEAITKRDQYALELVLAPQYIGISASGDVVTRNQQISHLFVKNEGPQSLEQKVINVRVVGEVAIVNGTYVMSWKGEKGPVLEKGIFTHVYEHVRNNWVCLNSQRTVVAEETKGADTEKPRAKRSDAELPVHIPLIYKGPDSTKAPPAPGTDQPPQ